MEQKENYFISDRRLYLTADQHRIVEEGDPQAAILYARPGTRIPAAAAEKFGLVKRAPQAQDKAVKQQKTRNKAARPDPPAKKSAK